MLFKQPKTPVPENSEAGGFDSFFESFGFAMLPVCVGSHGKRIRLIFDKICFNAKLAKRPAMRRA